MRAITSHRVNGLNDALKIEAVDPAGPGGANHCYMIFISDHEPNLKPNATIHTTFNFQNGPIAEVGFNGISNEALLAIVADRLQCFQRGEYACRENALALTKIEEAMHWLHHRTRERMQRGVEGTSVK